MTHEDLAWKFRMVSRFEFYLQNTTSPVYVTSDSRRAIHTFFRLTMSCPHIQNQDKILYTKSFRASPNCTTKATPSHKTHQSITPLNSAIKEVSNRILSHHDKTLHAKDEASRETTNQGLPQLWRMVIHIFLILVLKTWWIERCKPEIYQASNAPFPCPLVL